MKKKIRGINILCLAELIKFALRALNKGKLFRRLKLRFFRFREFSGSNARIAPGKVIITKLMRP